MSVAQSTSNPEVVVNDTPPAFPPGWYDRPDIPNTKDYWDGTQWTSHIVPADPPQETKAGGLVAIGYIFAVIIPLVGFILGIVVATRPSKATSKHGWAIILLSVVAFFIYLALLMNSIDSSINTTTVGY